MANYCLKCGAVKGKRVNVPTPCIMQGCKGKHVSVQKQMLPVAQAFYELGYPVCRAWHSIYGVDNDNVAVGVVLVFDRILPDDVLPELPKGCGIFPNANIAPDYPGLKYSAAFSMVRVKKSRAAALREAVRKLEEYACWLNESGMWAVLTLQGKLF